MQGSLLPFEIEIVREDPADLGSADSSYIGVGADGMPYLLKTTKASGGPYVPLSEWICSSLALRCNLSVPPFGIAIRTNGDYAFASRWEGGVVAPQTINDILTGHQPIKGGARLFGKCYAFDLFVYNHDRHMGNYLARDGGPLGHPVVLFPDYSRALLFHGWPLPPPQFQNLHNTETTIRSLAQHHNKEEMARGATELLQKLRCLPNTLMQEILKLCPTSWDPSSYRQAISNWWISDRHQRISEIENGITNGKYPALRNNQGNP